MSFAEDVTFSLKVMIDKRKSKVLFAEADSDFTDILLSFLTLPLGRIVKILEKHYGDKAPVLGSLTTLYTGLANLDSAHFWTEGAKLILLNPISSFESEYKKLKLDISDSQPVEFYCESDCLDTVPSVSVYYDNIPHCLRCYNEMKRRVARQDAQAAVCYDGVFTTSASSFVIFDNLQIVSNTTGVLQAMRNFGITDTCEAELMNVTFGINEIMNLLQASLITQNPLSDLILKKKIPGNSTTLKSEERTLSNRVDEVASSNTKKMILKVMVQKPTNKLLFAQAEEDFVEFLFSFLTIPLGGVECLLGNKASIKSIDNLYRSVADLIDTKYFNSPDAKHRLIKPNLPHGYISKDHIFPLTEETLPPTYKRIERFYSDKFPKGQGNYLKGPWTYMVADDLTVTPLGITSIISSLNELKIPVSDVEELELHIGLEEGLSILNASLTSTGALSSVLMNHILKKKTKQEH